MISIIHPSRSRPEKSWHNIAKWVTNSHCDVEVIVSLDADDPCLEEYLSYSGAAAIVNKNRSAVDAINNAAKIAKGDILIVVSDDTECFYGWGKQIEKLMHGKCDWILKTQCGIQDWIITMPIMDRIYYERFGYIYHPDYTHAFCDTELTCVADMTGCKIVSNYQFPHKHFDVTGEPKDELALRADSSFESGRKIFIDRKRRNFDLPEGMKLLTDNVYTRWK